MDEEEIESLQIKDGIEEANPFILAMVKFHLRKKGNFYEFLKTLSIDDLWALSNCPEKNKEKWYPIAVAMSTMAYSIEQGQYGKEFTVELEKLMDDVNAFCVMCALVVLEKLGLQKTEDNSYFWNPEGDLSTTINVKDCEEALKNCHPPSN